MKTVKHVMRHQAKKYTDGGTTLYDHQFSAHATT